MMTIDIKATKAAPEQTPSERYALKSMDKKSKIPLLIGGFATGIVLYVKSLFMEGAARPEPLPEPSNPQESDQGQGRAAPLRLVSASDDIITGSIGAAPEGESGDKGRSSFAMRSGSGSLELVDDAPLRFHTNLRSNWDTFAVSPVIPMPSNDNIGDRSAPPVAGGGGGAAGNPNDDRKRNEDDDDADTEADPDNRAPKVTGPVYLRDVVGCATMVIALSDLLRNVNDPDGDVLSVTELSVSSGTLTSSGAEWIYRGGALGPVTIAYKVTDGHYVVQQTATFSVLAQPPIYGDEADNVLLGTLCNDQIAGQGGDDNIDARAGDDIVDGGDGDDHIVGGAGHDIIYGRAGNDIVLGGTGNDLISGGAGDDRLFGEDGDDTIFGDEGNDILDGGDGNDILVGGSGHDHVEGGAGHDTIEGGDGDDRLRGSAGNDRMAGHGGDDEVDGEDGDDLLLGGEGSDVVRGGAGDDVVVAATDQAIDVYCGDEGNDTISYADAKQGLLIDLAAGRATGVEIGEDTISGFEHVIGGRHDDVFVAGAASVTFEGNGGSNEFVFGASAEPHHPVALYEIIDFKPGDLIKMSRYDIFEEVIDEAESALERVYGERIDEDDAAIRYRRDELNNIDKTIIEADLDGDQKYEITIALNGNHALLIVENP